MTLSPKATMSWRWKRHSRVRSSDMHRLALDERAQLRTLRLVRHQIDLRAKDVFKVELDAEAPLQFRLAVGQPLQRNITIHGRLR